jgi:hypothetical protein
MPLPGAVTHRLFERKVLLAVEKVETAHRSVVIRTAKNGVHHDTDAALKRDGIRRIPSDGRHRANDLRFRTGNTDINGVAWMAVRGVCDLFCIGEGPVVTEIDFPDPGNDQV